MLYRGTRHNRGAMVRAIGLIGMTGGFLAISPALRESVAETLSQASMTLEEHSPVSYIALGAVLFVGLLYYFSRGTAAR